jgi:hypothetical protein
LGSTALDALIAGIGEVDELESANPTPTGSAPRRPHLTRVVGRACVVLLSSHFEQYIRAVNEEAVTALLAKSVASDAIPVEIRLVHSRPPLEEVARTQWNRRKDGLEAFAAIETRLWIPNSSPTTLEADRLLDWMRAPKCKDVVRYYAQWEIKDIFRAITRGPRTRTHLWLSIGALVDKRNSIAHGDLTTEATQADVRQYKRAVMKFAKSADYVLARRLVQLFGPPRPW